MGAIAWGAPEPRRACASTLSRGPAPSRPSPPSRAPVLSPRGPASNPLAALPCPALSRPAPAGPAVPSCPPAPPLQSPPTPSSTTLYSSRVSPRGPAAPDLSPPPPCCASRSAPRRPGSPPVTTPRQRGAARRQRWSCPPQGYQSGGRSVPRSPGSRVALLSVRRVAGASRVCPSGRRPGRGEVSARPWRSPGSGRELNTVCGGSESRTGRTPGLRRRLRTPAPPAAPRRPTGFAGAA